MIRYLLCCLRFHWPIVIERPGPLQRLRIWRRHRARCIRCGRRMNGLMPGGLEARREWSPRADRRIFWCPRCTAIMKRHGIPTLAPDPIEGGAP